MKLFDTLEQMIAIVAEWDGVRLQQHRFGGTQFILNEQVFGHVRGNVVAILLPKHLRVPLVLEGQVEPHPVMPASGWVRIYLNRVSDEENALKVLGSAYHEIRRQTQASRPGLLPGEPAQNVWD